MRVSVRIGPFAGKGAKDVRHEGKLGDDEGEVPREESGRRRTEGR